MRSKRRMFVISHVLAGAILLGALPLYAAGQGREASSEDGDSPGFSIGYNQYYAWWSGRPWVVNDIGKSADRPATGPMFNPIIGIRFNDMLMLSASFAFSRFWYNYTGPVLTDRFDADLLLAITLPKGFRIFFGPKYMGWLRQNAFNSIGLGMGVSYIRTLYRGLFVNASVSLITMLDFNLFKSPEPEGGVIQRLFEKKKSGAFVVGASPTAALGYYFREAGITLSAGCRFQYLYYTVAISSRAGLSSSSVQSDYIVAPYIGLTYSFR